MATNWLGGLNEDQQAAARWSEGPVVILAGAGSGKTKVLTYRAAYLIKEKGINPDKILLLTFTNQAGREMRERITKLAGSNRLPWAGTFHSWCARMLRREGRWLGIAADYLIYDEKDQQATVKATVKRMNLNFKEFKPQAVAAAISQAKNELIGTLEYQQYARGWWQEKVAEIYGEYQKSLKEAAALDFDDLLMEAVRLFQKQPDVLAGYQNRYEYVLVDEYQDTNQAQYLLTKLLAGKWRNLCVVGDFSQSIYSWRGADFRNLQRLKEDFADLKMFALERNYRSTQTILSAANAVVAKNTSHPVLKLWTDKNGGARIRLVEADDEREEARFVVETIKNAQNNNYAVLYRTNAQSRVIEEELIRAGVVYRLVGGTRFYDRREIKDLLAYLRLVVNEKDKVSWERVEKLGKRKLNKWKESLKLLKNTKGLERMTTLELLDEVLRVTGYLDLYDERIEEDLMRLENIKELKSVAYESSDLVEFLENVALIEHERARFTESQGSQVTLMTLHGAKGLEFEGVFMVGMEEGLFPHSRSFFNKEELEEERRLAYVGMTRAKEELYLTYARRRLYFGQRAESLVSRFVGEIPRELVEEWVK
ncbi:MAG: UvrD-helicase domain-containing protein [Candidatus Chisholmbacteria bacterium]|nr:UvrD-helicase domain-containing protein [Candidatus Chisholmbacteria bacterium]